VFVLWWCLGVWLVWVMVFGLCFCWWGLVVFGVVWFFGCCCLGFLVLGVVFQVFSVLAIVRLTALTE
jgi:hypothetical protein